IVSLAYPLQEQPKIEVFIIPGNIQAKLITRVGVANDSLVSGIAQNTTATVNLTITVKVAVHNITGAPITADSTLFHSLQMFIHFFPSFSKSGSFISPNFSYHSASIPGTNITCGIIIFGNFLPVVGQYGPDVIVKVANLISPVHLQFKTIRFQIRIINLWNRSSQDSRQLGRRANHIVGCSFEVVESYIKLVIKHSHIQTYVPATYALPGKLGTYQSRGLGCIGLFSINYPYPFVSALQHRWVAV